MARIRAEQLRRWIQARKRILAETKDNEIARLCLIWIDKDQAELDLIEAIDGPGSQDAKVPTR